MFSFYCVLLTELLQLIMGDIYFIIGFFVFGLMLQLTDSLLLARYVPDVAKRRERWFFISYGSRWLD